MRLRSIYWQDEPAVVREEPDGRLLRLAGVEAIGAPTPLELLRESAASASEELDPASVRARPAVPDPHRIVCVGLNYREHIEESGRSESDYPVLFTKWASSLVADGAPVILPPEASAGDYEAELAVVIGKRGRRIPAELAIEHVAGFTIANDVTMRDYQQKTHQWLQGKAWDASTPLGPALVTLDELENPFDLEISLELNGEMMQRSRTSLLIFDIPTLIATISEFTELEPGYIVLTGTPSGVGYRREPRVCLADGDRMRITIEGLGTLENPVVAEAVAR
ncbi:MAG TPA: fumarylacetoacetate hydrolase family protein [Solirubrobacteraceae bacterium]|jgi:acylpyruvate hydrolase|nr:fumarylacetoacetate hydrolase family protein [Solirubrobacteraceae bacterium]